MEPKSASRVYQNHIKVISVSFLIYLFYPIILPFYLLILVYRQLVCVVVKRDRQIKKIMSGFDNFFAYPSPYKDPRNVLLAMYPVTSSVDINHVKRHLESGLLNAKFTDGSLKFPELKQRIVSKWGYSFWRQAHSFSLDNHVKYLCPEDPFRTVQRSEFSQLLKFTGNNFNPEFSPWELHVVPNFVDPEDASVKGLLVIRIHHAMADGFALVNLTHHMSLYPKTSSVNPNSLPMSWNPIDWIVSIKNLLVVLFKIPYVFTHKLVFQPDFNPLWEAARNFPSTHQDAIYIESKPMSLTELKPIQIHCNVRPASVVIGIYVEVILEAMRLKNVPLPDELNFAIPFPAPSHSGLLTNCFVTDQMVVKICRDDPLQTLKNIEASYSQFRDSDISLLVAYFVEHFMKLPTTFVDKKGKKPGYTGLLTNFRYGVKQFDMFGYEVTEVGCYGSLVQSPPFAFSCVGYNGKIRFCGGVPNTLFDERDAKKIKGKFNSQIKTYLSMVGKNINIK